VTQNPRFIVFHALWSAHLVCLMVGTPLADEATTLLDRAIKAQGGEEKLNKAQGATFQVKGTADIEGMKAELGGDVSTQGANNIHWNAAFTAMGRTENGTIIITSEKIWAKGGNREAEEAPKEVAFIRDVFRTIRLCQNLSTVPGKDVTLSHLGELKIDKQTAVGLKIATKGRPDIDVFFDKETHLPLRAEVRVTEPGQANEVLYAFFFSDYKDVNGIQCASKMTFKRDDKTTMEVEFSEFKFMEKLDETLFAKP
jgi:hypothetical protein